MPKPDRAQYLDLELKVGEVDDAGVFEGLASMFGELDMVGDTIAPGAFKKSLAAHKRAGRMPLLLWMHDLTAPIGRWTSIQETATGLAVRGKLTLATAKGREAYELLKEKALDGLSIGFRTVKASRIKTGRLLEELDLAEISLCTMPALASARVHSVKSRRPAALPLKDSPMTDDIDGAVETASYDLPPDMLERIEAVETKAGVVDEIAGRLDRIETRLARPSARVEVKEDQAALETKTFLTWCRKGVDGLGDLEKKVFLSTIAGSPTAGGWNLVPQTFLQELQRNLVEFSPMRSLARVQQVSGNPVTLPKRTQNLQAAWVAEEIEHDVSQPGYEQQSIPIFEARVTVEVTNQLLEDSAFDLGAELALDFAEEFARLESLAFVMGNGTTEPEGFLTSSLYTEVGGGATADGLIDLFYSIPSRYSSRGTFVMPRSRIAAVRKLKTAQGYLWTESLQPGQPASILGRPVVEFPDLADTVGSPTPSNIVFGDWRRAYRVLDRVSLEVLRDPYTKARFSVVAFHARKRVGGALVDGQAIKGLTT
jgi:HK97 family phage major capsid protein/HK97 family phage prohead protease